MAAGNEERAPRSQSAPCVMAALMEGNVEVRHYDQLYYKRADVRTLIRYERADRRRTRCRLASLNKVDIEIEVGKVLSTKVAYHLGHFARTQGRGSRLLAARSLPERQISS